MPFVIALLLLLASPALPPSALGTLRVAIAPKVIRPGDSVRFEAGLFSPGLCPHWATYTIHPAGDRPDAYVVRVWADSTDGKCASAMGFSGPQLHIVAKVVGHYAIRFDSASVFRPDMGDSAVFRVEAPTGLARSAVPARTAPRSSEWRVDGRRWPPSGIPEAAEN